MSTFAVFETSYAKSNQETLRWASVALAAFLTVIALIWAAVLSTKKSFREAMSSDEGSWKMLMLALYFIMTVAATFLSWYVAALHIGKNNLIALDVLNFVIAVCIGFASYFMFRSKDPMPGVAHSFLTAALVLEFVALIVLMISPQAAGSAGSLVQSTLYVPLLVSTIAMSNYQMRAF